MKIAEVRKKYPNYKISYLPKKDYLEGIKPRFKVKFINETKYDEVFIAKIDNRNHFLLYPHRDSMTGSFLTREKAIDWFRKGGR